MNLEIAFPETTNSQLKEIALWSYRNSVLTFSEFVRPETAWWNIGDMFGPMINEEHYRNVGRNPLVLTAHIGNWEAAGYVASREGLPFTALAKPLHNPLINAAVLKQRVHSGIKVIGIDQSLKAAIDAAKRGEWLGFLADQDARRHGIFVPFFNRPASTATGIALFSQKLNMPILPVFCVRDKSPHRRPMLLFAPVITPDRTTQKEMEIERLTRLHVASLENVVRQYPEQYFWLHNRWKTRPKKSDTKAKVQKGAVS